MYAADEKPLYFLYLIQKSRYSFGIKWKNAKDLIMNLFGNDICSKLIDDKIINSCSDNNAMEIINIYDIKHNIDQDSKEEIFNKFISYYKDNPLVTGLMKIVYIDRKISQFFISLIKENMGYTDYSNDNGLIMSIPVIMSDDFYYSGAFADYCKTYLENIELDMDGIKPYLKNEWFIETVMVIRDGSFINTETERSDYDYINGLIELIKNDYLSEIFINADIFFKNDDVNHYINKYNYRHVKEKKLKKFYDWLAIANDIMVGIEFVVGSILFLPYLPPIDGLHGVYLFIIGSSQLLIRPVIQILKRIHLFFLHKNR